jgi:hypothetical protein
MEKFYTVTVQGKQKQVPINRSSVFDAGGETRIDIFTAENAYTSIEDSFHPDQSYDEILDIKEAAQRG